MPRLLFILPVLFLIAFVNGASAQSAFNVTWASLDPGNDWAWQMLQSVFPVNGTPPTIIGNANTLAGGTTVIGQILGQLTGFVMAVAMSYVCYITIMNIHRVSETSQILSNSMTSMFLVRIGFAAVMMLPLASGFSTGQAAVLQVAGWGIGMARAVYANAIQAIGPDAMLIAQPAIPGTGTIVLNLMEDELCRALINQAAGSTLVPIPVATTSSYANGGYITYAYNMAPGNGTGNSTCGSVTIGVPLTGGATLEGVNVDMTAQQQAILVQIVSTMQPAIDTIAANYWSTKQQSALSPLLGLYQTYAASYTALLTQAAQQMSAALQAAVQASQDARNGNMGLTANQTQQSTLGWTSAGAYYLEFSRLNGQTLALASSTPVVNLPNFEGLSTALASDITPFFDSATSLLAKLKTYVQSGDGITIPTGNGNLSTSSVASTDGQSAISSLFNTLNLGPGLMAKIISFITPPTGSQWSDPFGSLIGLGQTLINAALVALGLAGIASSTTGTVASTFTSFFTGGPGAAVASLALGALMQFFAQPIFYACMALLLPGLTIAYVLPMIPWILWMAGVAGYLILVCEALIAVPLWMLAHMTFEGEGLHGRGLAGYELLFNVLFRPVLMLLGLFMGYFIFTCMSWLIRQSFGIAAGFVLGNGWFVTNFLGLFVLLSIFTMMHVTAAFMSFRLISQLPHHLPRMIGFSGQNRVDTDQFANDAAIVGVGGTLRNINTTFQPKTLNPAGNSNQSALPSPQKMIGSRNIGSTSGGNSPQSNSIDQTLQATTAVSHSSPTQEA